jgi:hypothetical protein
MSLRRSFAAASEYRVRAIFALVLGRVYSMRGNRPLISMTPFSGAVRPSDGQSTAQMGATDA